jgi:hypothetical protein
MVRRALSACTAVFLLWLLAAQSPHLVHHVFEPDEVQNECPLAGGADRSDGVTPCAADAAPGDVIVAPMPSSPPAAIVAPARGPSLARAPPALAA